MEQSISDRPSQIEAAAAAAKQQQMVEDEKRFSDGTEETASQSNATQQDSSEPDDDYIHGPRLTVIKIALWLSLFLANLEVPIVSTSIVSITDALHGFDQSGWIVTAYLVAYVGCLMIWASISDIVGRKPTVIAAIVIFVIFSGACGAAQTMTQLIVFRALQGIGGSGVYVVPFAINFDLVPPKKYPLAAASIAVVFMISLLLGPIFGGAINDSGQWRWVFLLNVPAGFVAGVIWLVALPAGFPHHNKNMQQSSSQILARFKRIDYLGAFFLIAANVLFLSALQEAGIHFPWRSAYVITLLTLSGVFLLTFLFWERYLTTHDSIAYPVFPWRLVNRHFIGILGNMFFLGALFTTIIFLVPQRFIVVNDQTPLQAGLRLVPFTVFSPVGSVIATVIIKKVPAIYVVVVGSCLQIIGFALLTTLPISEKLYSPQYGFEIIAGFGAGLNIPVLTVLVPYTIEKRDTAIGNGVFNQFRYLGGAFLLAITVSVLNSYLNSQLNDVLSPQEVSSLLQSNNILQTFSPAVQEQVREVFGRGYNINMKILVAFAAAQIPWSALIWKKQNIRIQS